jgi:hypothetical protein
LATDSAAARRLRGRTTADAGKSPGPSPGANESDMFDASFSAFVGGHPSAAGEEVTFSTEFVDSGLEGSSTAFSTFEGNDVNDEKGNPKDGAFDGGGDPWTDRRIAQLQPGGTVTADGFPAAHHSAETEAQIAATKAHDKALAILLKKEAEIAAKLEELKLAEAQLRRTQNNM